MQSCCLEAIEQGRDERDVIGRIVEPLERAEVPVA